MSSPETKVYLALFVAVTIIAVFLLFFIITIVRYHEKYQRLFKQLVFAEIRVLEKERKRIATDLHDDFGQLISIIRMQVGGLQARNAHEKEQLRLVIDHLNDAARRTRNMSESLLPNNFFRQTSLENIWSYINQVNRLKKVRISFTCRVTSFLDDEESDLHFFRIIQELISNTLKHSHARSLDLLICMDKHNLLLSSVDDGRGFDLETAHIGNAGSGLRNIHNRVALLNGTLFLHAAPGKGVQYEISIPIPPERKKMEKGVLTNF